MPWRPFPITLDVMNFPPRKTPLRLTAAAAAACLLLTGCDPTDSGSSDSPAVAGGALKTTEPTTGPTTGLCPAPGPKISTALPDLTGSGIRSAVTNPCVPFVDLVAAVLDVTAEEDAVKSAFTPTLARFVERVNAVNTTAECAYRTDNLGVRVYQEDNRPTSIGVAIVIRHNVLAPAQIFECYVKSSLGIPQDPGVLPEFRPCVDGANLVREGETFTMVWAGSTEAVCDALQRSAN